MCGFSYICRRNCNFINMVKVLLRLWWVQKKRTFDWKKLGILIYFFLCIVMMIGGFLWGVDANLTKILHDQSLQIAAVPIAMGVIPICLMSMFLMKIEENGMDNAIKSRPISKLTWGQFIVVSSIVDYWTAFPPILMAIVAVLIMPFGYALLTFVLAYMLSVTIALFVTSVRLSNDHLLTIATWVGFACFLMFLTFVMIVGVSMLTGVALAFAIGVITVLYACSLFVFIYNLDGYNEQKKHKTYSSKHSKVGRFTMEWAALWRTKRFKKPIILFLLFFTGEAYLMVNLNETDMNSSVISSCYLFFIFIILYAPLMLGQFMLGIEANFIDGLLTKPYALEDHLLAKYYFFMCLNALSALLLVPGVVFNLWGLDLIIASVVFSFAIDLLLFITCLKSRRIDLFSSGFFNYQGANMGFNVYGLMPIVGIGIYIALLIMLPSIYLAEAILFLLGFLAFVVHKRIIKMIAKRFMERKYARLEELRK